jgi:hypothetical protein
LTPYDALHSKCTGCGQIIIGTYTNFLDLDQQDLSNVIHHFPSSSIHRPRASINRSYRSPIINSLNIENEFGGIIKNQQKTTYHQDGSVSHQKITTDKSKLGSVILNNTIPDDIKDSIKDSNIIRNQRNTTYFPDGSVVQQRRVITKPKRNPAFSYNNYCSSIPSHPTHVISDSDIIRNQRNTTYFPDGSITQQRKVISKPKSSLFSRFNNIFSQKDDVLGETKYQIRNNIYHPDGSVSQQRQQVIDDLPTADKITTVEQKIIDNPDGSLTHRKIITKEPDYHTRHKIMNKDGSISYRKYTSDGYEDIITHDNGTIVRRVVERKDKSSSGIGAFNLYGKF